ncbi:MAG: M14 family zinc carboxypeptidase [Bacteroidota bacterium]
MNLNKLARSILPVLFSFPLFAQIDIDDNFAGGNVIIERIANDTVYFSPDLTGTEGEWFYWHFSARSSTPKKWFFKATKPNLLTNLGAAYSKDAGYNWQWIDKANHLTDDLFSFTFSRKKQVVHFSFGQPYTQKQFDRFIDRYEANKHMQLATLCQSNEGRDVEKLLISDFDREPVCKILLIGRAHACEMMTSYLLEGVIESLLSDNSAMQDLLKKAEIMIIPFLDKDGVENGDQGKNRIPRDHNRDYKGKSLFSTTSTLRSEIPDWLDRKPWVGIDLHNPWIKGKGNEHIYLVGNTNPKIAKEQQKFVHIIAQTKKETFTFNEEESFLAYGESWNTGGNYEKGWPFSKWASSFSEKGLLLTTTLEFPYALVHQTPVTADNTRQFGKDFIHALAEYLRQNGL